jgi:DNA-binding SARP family transcriptional activator/TolB-like protein
MFTLRLLGSAALDGPSGPVTGRAAMRQRIALLALLAIEHPRPLSRDKLLAFLWPEKATDDARHLLRESLYILRSALGDDAVLSAGDDLRLNPDRLTCDLWEFEAALARDDLDHAVGVYLGPFLSGFHLSDAEEFERWVDAERSRLARRYGQALEQLAERAARSGNRLGAVEWWSRLAADDPYNSRIALGYMQALDAAGDRAGALRHAAVHSELLRTDLDAAPENEVIALAERLRVESRPASGGVRIPTQPTSPVAGPAGRDEPERPLASAVDGSVRPAHRGWLLPAVLGLALMMAVGLLGGTLSRARTPELAPRRVAVAVFENHTGRPDLNDLGYMTADWIIQGLMETPLIDVTDLEAIYARESDDSAEPTDPRALARAEGAGLVIWGNYYRSGDSVVFQASLVDVATGRVLRSFVPMGAPITRPGGALEALREGVAANLSALVNPAGRIFSVDPDLTPPPNFSAYREFIAGLREREWESASPHWRRAAELDSTFVAPLIQLAAIGAHIQNRCDLTDSIGTALRGRRQQLTAWDRYTLEEALASCRGDIGTVTRLLRERHEAYPRSNTAQRRYVASLVRNNRPKAALEILRLLDPLDPWFGWAPAPQGHWAWTALSQHMLGQYLAELEVTERWRDSAAYFWPYLRGRALAALRRDREVLELLRSLMARPIEDVSEALLGIAAELAVHGHERTAMAVAESVLVHLRSGSGADSAPAWETARANRLLGRTREELAALERVPGRGEDLDLLGRIAVLRADTAEADRIDSVLAEQSREPLRSASVRGERLLARAHIAVGLGRREQALARLREAMARGEFSGGAFHAFHSDPLLAPLRGYPPFEALLSPRD